MCKIICLPNYMSHSLRCYIDHYTSGGYLDVQDYYHTPDLLSPGRIIDFRLTAALQWNSTYRFSWSVPADDGFSVEANKTSTSKVTVKYVNWLIMGRGFESHQCNWWCQEGHSTTIALVLQRQISPKANSGFLTGYGGFEQSCFNWLICRRDTHVGHWQHYLSLCTSIEWKQ